MADPIVAVDLDGTLAWHDENQPVGAIGAPIPTTVRWVNYFLARGYKVVIFTARATDPATAPIIQDWLEREALLPRLEVTNVKVPEMVLFIDDKAVRCVQNTGQLVGMDIVKLPLPPREQGVPRWYSR